LIQKKLEQIINNHRNLIDSLNKESHPGKKGVYGKDEDNVLDASKEEMQSSYKALKVMNRRKSEKTMTSVKPLS
jgi:hypothetical protein